MILDAIIVGQGIAGSLLAWRMFRDGKRIAVIDMGHRHASSRVGAGIVNPVTGRRFVLGWRLPEMRSHALPLYGEMQDELGIHLLHHTHIIRSVHSARDYNHVSSRMGDPIYQPYLFEGSQIDRIEKLVNPAYRSVGIQGGFRVDIPLLIKGIREMLSEKEVLLEEPFRHTALEIRKGEVRYGGINARKIVFCEGAAAIRNPFFEYLPFRPSKGQALIVEAEFPPDVIYKNRLFLVPIGNGRIWAGSYNQWTFDEIGPTEEGRRALLERLGEIYQSTFRLEEVRAAVRPTVKHRRPLLGRHPVHENLWIFNGLGTKGVILAPYWSRHIMEAMETGTALDPEVDIRKYDELHSG